MPLPNPGPVARRVLAALAALLVLAFVAACGGDGDDTAAETAPATRVVTHAFGTTEVPTDPQRVVSVGYEEQDFILNFGVVPVLQRDYTGNQPYAVWPWSQPMLGDATPDTFTEEMPYEKIAAAKPDLIMATNSGIDRKAYQRLSDIAPTVARHPDYGDWETPWDDTLRQIGEVFGQEEKAEEQIAEISDRLAEIREAHPGWADMEGVSVTIWEQPNVDVQHPRGAMLRELGFVLPPEIEKRGPKEGAVPVPLEEIELLDRELVVWFNGDDDPAVVRDLRLRTSLDAHAEGREVYADKVLTQAFTNQSPAAFDYVFDNFIPLIEAAVDGDPSTPVESSVTAGIAP